MAENNNDALKKRGFLALEDGEWEKAEDFFEQALNQDAEDAESYLGKLMASMHAHNREELINCNDSFESDPNYKKAIRFNPELETEFLPVLDAIRNRSQKIAFEQKAAKDQKSKAIMRVVKIAAPIVAVIILISVLLPTLILPAGKYNKAASMYKSGDYDAAYALFTTLGSFKDAEVQALACYYDKAAVLCQNGDYDNAITIYESLGDYEESKTLLLACHYDKAIELEHSGRSFEAGMEFFRARGYKDAFEISKDYIIKLNQIHLVSAGDQSVAGIRSDGSVLVVAETISRDQSSRELSDEKWNNIISVGSGYKHTIGLRKDGTVVSTFNTWNDHDKRIELWNGVVEIDASSFYSVGRTANGDVLKAGMFGGLSGPNDIISIASGDNYMLMLHKDGTVTASGEGKYGQCDVEEWNDIVAIDCGQYASAGLRADGTVITTNNGILDPAEWNNIVSISMGDNFLMGLKVDGTVLTTDKNKDTFSSWTDIVGIASGKFQGIGLRSDGTVVMAGAESYYSEHEFKKWKNMMTPDALIHCSIQENNE